MQLLAKRGGVLCYHDPYVPALRELGLESVPLDDAVSDADAVVLVTVHPGIDHLSLASNAALFIDLRGATRGLQSANVVRL